MSYTIKLGTFSKLENSTARPTITSWAEYDVNLKDGCDISNPEITLSISYSTVSAYNYAYFMNRYYWIVAKNMIRESLCVLSLKVDVLATYKTQIGAASLYVLRSAAASDGNIIDRSYPTSSITYGRSEDSSFLPGTYASGSYIVSCVGMTSSGGSNLWKMSPTKFRSMLYSLYNKIDGFQVADIKDAISKFLQGSPEKLLSSAMWMPAYNFTTSTLPFYVGGWRPTNDFTADLITDPIFAMPAIELDLPKHPQAASRGSYLNLAPFTTYTLCIPMFGSINIDTTAVKDASKIYLNITVDAMSGQGKCKIHSGGNPRPLIATLTAQIGVAVPLQGQNAGSSIAGGIATTLAATAAAVASGGAAAPIIGAVASGVDTAINAVTGASFSMGSAGGALATTQNITLDATFLNIADEDNTHHGRPLYDSRTISTLSGYNIVADGDVAVPGPLPEQREVQRFLESGFFYE